MSEARMLFKKNVGGNSAVADLLNPSRGIRDDMLRKGKQPKDHMRENMKKIEEIKMKKIEEEEELERKKNQKQFKLKEFEGIPSRVQQATESVIDSPTTRHDFLKKSDKQLKEPTKQYVREGPRRPSIPKPVVYESKHEEKNYLAENRSEVHRMVPKEHEIKPLVPPVDPSYQRGKVPDYLIKRKEEKLREDEYIRMHQPDPECPPGMIKLPDSERLETLQALTETLEILQNEHMRLPLVIETQSAKRRVADLESKIKETEDAIKVFSRTKVFIMPD